MAGPRFRALLVRLRGMMLGIGLGTWAGSGLIVGGAAHVATQALGTALIIYAALGLTRLHLRVPVSAERWAGPLVGMTTGW
jgi:hypothetical protein